MLDRAVRERRPGNRAPAIELFVGPVVPVLQGAGAETRRAVDDMARIVEIPVARHDATFGLHPLVQLRAGVRRLDVKGGGRQALLDGPIHRAPEHVRVVVVHAEDEAAVDHDAEIVQPTGHGGVIASEVLPFVAAGEIAGGERFEAYKQTAQPRVGGPLDEIAAQNGIHCRRALKQAVHAAHAVEESAREALVAEQVIIEEVQMPAGQPGDLGQCIVHALGVEAAPALEKGILVAEVTVLGTPAGDHNRIGHEISRPLDEIAPDRRQPLERAARRRLIPPARAAGAEVGEELGKCLLAGTEEDGIGVGRGFVGQGRDVQAAERHEHAARPIAIRKAVRAMRIGDVDLDQHEVRRVVGVEARHVLVDDDGPVFRRQVRRQRGEAERREERVLDGAPVGTRGFGERGKHERHAERPPQRHASLYIIKSLESL